MRIAFSHALLPGLAKGVCASGRAFAIGRDITGTSDGQDGQFRREMDRNGKEIPLNCQLVEACGTREIRFAVDRGDGRSATFTLH